MGVHQELDIRPGLTLDEFRILRRIAVLDTLELHQRPRMVHLLGACVCRLKDLKYEPAGESPISVEDVRRWAVSNFPADDIAIPPDPVYRVPIDFKYEISKRGGSMRLRLLRNAPIPALNRIRRLMLQRTANSCAFQRPPRNSRLEKLSGTYTTTWNRQSQECPKMSRRGTCLPPWRDPC